MSEKSNEKRSRRSTYEIVRNEPIPNLKKGYFHVLNANNGKGKTHYLSNIAQWCLRDLNLKYLQRDDIREETDKYTNLICLSGTAFDKFDRYGAFKKYLNNNNRLNHFYYYTGYTTNIIICLVCKFHLERYVKFYQILHFIILILISLNEQIF